MRILVLQHIAREPPAAYEDELRDRAIDLVRVEVDEGEPVPDWRDFGGIVAMGGPMGAYEEREYPWLATEKRFIRSAVESGLPFWGVCLGAQLLASSLGAPVWRGPEPELGLLSVETTPAADVDPVFQVSPARFETLQWHNDTFELPDGATLLASSPAYRNQAFVWKRAYGLQFHLEASSRTVREWVAVPSLARSLTQALGDDALPRLVEELDAKAHETLPLARRLFGRWLEEVVGVDRRESPRPSTEVADPG